MTTTLSDLDRMRADIIADALAIVAIEARLREQVSHAIERAPTVAAWVTGRIALGRVRGV